MIKFLFFIMSLSFSQIYAENTFITYRDSSAKDTIKLIKPAKAALYSTVLPGLGQAYNRSWWKIPIVYGIIGTVGAFVWINHKEYLVYRDALRSRYDDDPNTNDKFPNLNDQILKSQREYYRRNRDLILILGVISYGLNVLDAYVDAHLKQFTVSDQLSLKIFFSPMPGNFAGVSVKLFFH